MAKPPMLGAALQPADAAAAGAAEGAAPPDDGEEAMGEDEAQTDEPGDENVLLTVVKEADGTYSLIKGDEQDASGMDAAGSADAEGAGAEAEGGAPDENKQSFNSKGALLKAILDILDQDESAGEGSDGGGDQFEAGFAGADATAAPAPIPQKF